MKKWRCPVCKEPVQVEVDYKGRIVLFDGEEYHKCIPSQSCRTDKEHPNSNVVPPTYDVVTEGYDPDKIKPKMVLRDKELVELKRPLQSILIVDVQVMAKVIKGEKKITIRDGYRDYVLGKVVFVVDSAFGVTTIATVNRIKRLQWKLLKDVTHEEMNAEGFFSTEEMLKGLRRFYPEIDILSPVTVIEWE